jgi:hypothetical protein
MTEEDQRPERSRRYDDCRLSVPNKMHNDGYDWTVYDFKAGEELDVLDLIDEVWCHVTVVKVHNGPKKRAITVHWTGWENDADTEILESEWADLLAPVGTHVQQVRCWVTLVNAASLPKWPAVVHIRQPSADPRHRRGQQALMEKTMVTVFCFFIFLALSSTHTVRIPHPPRPSSSCVFAAAAAS